MSQRASRDKRGSVERRASFSRDQRGSFASGDEKPTRSNRRASRGSKDDMGPETPVMDEDKRKKMAETRQNRRAQTMQRMMVTGAGAGLNELSGEIVHGLPPGATPKQKMERVMIAAKERGMTAAQIFGEFVGSTGEGETATEDNYDIEIEPEQFRDALDRLVPNVFNVTKQELKALIDEFDTDGNGTISVLEFREFCYRIPHLAWKAERLRYEREAESKGMSTASQSKKHIKMDVPETASTDKGSGSPKRDSIKPNTYREAYSGTKVFWHAKEKMQIKIVECTPPRGGGSRLPGPILAVLTYSENARVAHAPIFVDTAAARELVNRTMSSTQFEDLVEQAVVKLEANQRGKKANAGDREQAKMQIMRDAVANVVLLRLKLGKAPSATQHAKPALELLSSDVGDAVAERLQLAAEAAGVTLRDLIEYAFEVREEVNFATAKQELAALKTSMEAAGAETKAAARAQKLLSMSMDALETLRKTLDEQAKMSAGKKKWMMAFRRRAVREEVKRVRVRLESSPSYHALLKEQAEKRAASGA